MALLEVHDAALEYTLSASPVPVLLAIVSETCPHCVRLKPNLAALAQQYQGKVQAWALVAERSPQHGPVFSADGVPTLIGFVKNQPVWRQVGAPEPALLATMFEDLARRKSQGW